jgi:hypothetical protein
MSFFGYFLFECKIYVFMLFYTSEFVLKCILSAFWKMTARYLKYFRRKDCTFCEYASCHELVFLIFRKMRKCSVNSTTFSSRTKKISMFRSLCRGGETSRQRRHPRVGVDGNSAGASVRRGVMLVVVEWRRWWWCGKASPFPLLYGSASGDVVSQLRIILILSRPSLRQTI